MRTEQATLGRRTGSRDEETTRFFQRLVLPTPAEPRPMPEVSPAKANPYLLAPTPWPRGQFQIDPER
jgi:hypothetical protein